MKSLIISLAASVLSVLLWLKVISGLRAAYQSLISDPQYADITTSVMQVSPAARLVCFGLGAAGLVYGIFAYRKQKVLGMVAVACSLFAIIFPFTPAGSPTNIQGANEDLSAQIFSSEVSSTVEAVPLFHEE